MRRARALSLVESLQRHFTDQLAALDAPFSRFEWQRDEGRHGGGVRYGTKETDVFNRASVNVSCVHYDDEPTRKLASATALSTIIHPLHPRAPSLHLHVSSTELRSGVGTWRLMADLNPSHPDDAQTTRFTQDVAAAIPQLAADARAQGDRYFFIPALERHRGVTHFYVESFSSGDFDADLLLAERFARTAIDTYLSVVREAPTAQPSSNLERAIQLAYHTLYFFQVLTLDRGTTSGLLVHDQNDLGIMGSLPSFIDRELLASWEAKVPAPQHELVRALLAVVPKQAVAEVDDEVRVQLARVVREHYRRHPQALELQAAGEVVPPTVENHRASATK